MFVIRDLLKNEGFAGFFKGLTPKVLSVCTSLHYSAFRLLTCLIRSVVGPKLIFSFTLAQSLIPYFGK